MLCIDKLRIEYNIFIKISNVYLKNNENENWWREQAKTYNYFNVSNEYCYSIYKKHDKICFNWNFIKNIFNEPTKNDLNQIIKIINNYYNLNLTLKENNIFYTPLKDL